MSDPDRSETSIPLVEEHATLQKRVVETGKVRIRSVVDEKLVRIAEELERDDVVIDRIAVNREVTELSGSREEDGVLIVPVYEEVLVIEKRLMLKEELHIHRNPKRERIEEAVRLKSMRAEVERVPAPSAPTDTATEREPESEPTSREPSLHRDEPLIRRRD